MRSKEQEGIRVFAQGDLLCLFLGGAGQSLALVVLHVELLGELAGAHDIGGGQKFKGGQRRLEPAGGVQARSQHEADIACSHLADLHLGYICEREQPLALGLADLAQSLADQVAVLANEGRQVGDGAQRDQVEQVRQVDRRGGSTRFLEQGFGDLEGDAHAGQVFIGINIAVLFRIYHRK